MNTTEDPDHLIKHIKRRCCKVCRKPFNCHTEHKMHLTQWCLGVPKSTQGTNQVVHPSSQQEASLPKVTEPETCKTQIGNENLKKHRGGKMPRAKKAKSPNEHKEKTKFFENFNPKIFESLPGQNSLQNQTKKV